MPDNEPDSNGAIIYGDCGGLPLENISAFIIEACIHLAFIVAGIMWARSLFKRGDYLYSGVVSMGVLLYLATLGC
jgi:hypothetical protein